ncbi:MAG: Uma2 family endonuclease [Leptospiraceae bacterium]|nr:Uma2 family endonuclease [Leptospiraceae bacterium]MCP5493917.1 Uma2 family endonuclease [Leptospiraceae bacterium]
MISLLETPQFRQSVCPLSLKAYHVLRDSGQISENMEFIKGILIEKMTIKPIHSYITGIFADIFPPLIPDGFHLRKAEPITLQDSEPEPDIAIVSGVKKDYIIEHPKTAIFIVEVALSSIYIDREKANIYAEAGVREYWICDLNFFKIEVYKHPTISGYEQKEIFDTNDLVPVPFHSHYHFCLGSHL